MEVREPGARYLVAPTHQQTEVGTIPADWRLVTIGDERPYVTSGSRGWAAYYADVGALFVRITNLSRTCIYPDLEDLRFVRVPADESEALRTQLRAGDVLISITADIGIVGFVSEHIPLPAYINQHIALVRFDASKTNPKFVSYFLASAGSQRLFRALTDAGAKAGMNLSTVRAVAVALPPTEREQSAIANALSDTDTLIESLEQLLAKKRQIKQGAMQELLTGQRRLLGFSAAWSAVRLDRLGTIYGGLSGKTKVNFGRGSARYIPFMNVMANPVIDSHWLERVDVAVDESQNLTRRGDLFFNGSSETPEEVGLCSVLLDEVPNLYLNSFCFGFRFKPEAEVAGLFWAYWFRSSAGRRAMSHLAQGATRYNISKAAFLRLGVPSVTFAEQTAIATTLSDMDAELTALQARLAKARQLKQGMAQALLTGRIRLV